jgi:protein O-mannosyl-transferase
MVETPSVRTRDPAEKCFPPFWTVALLPAVLAFLFYLPVLKNDFVNWDDPENILQNPHLRSLGWDSIRWMFTHFYAANWIPLTWISLALDFRMGGLDPAFYHLHNLLLHCCNTTLVFFISLKVLDPKAGGWDAGIDRDSWKIPAAFLTALLFGLHPIHVESVAWATERKDVLYSLFYLSSLWIYLTYCAGAGWMPWKYLLCLGLFLLSLLAKPMAVTLPLVLLLLDFWPLDRYSSGFRRALLEKIPFLAVAFGAGWLTLLAHAQEGPVPSTALLPLGYRVMNALHSPVFYLGKMVFPAGLGALYPIVLLKTYSLPYLVSAAAVVAATGACLACRRSRPYWMAAWFYYLLTLAPTLGIEYAGGYAAADRFTYLPCLGPFLLVGSLSARFFCKRRLFFSLLAALLAVLMGAGTIRQLATWKDSTALWKNAAVVDSPYVINLVDEHLADAYRAQGRWDEALEALNAAIALDPQNAGLREKKGVVLLEKGLLPPAAAEFGLESVLDPSNAMAHRYLYLVNQKMGRHAEALAEAEDAARLDPSDPEVFNSLGAAYFSTSQYGKAAEAFERAHAMDPGNLQCLMNLAAAYNLNGRTSKTLEALRAAAALQPRNPEIYRQLGQVYRKAGKKEMAGEAFEEWKSLGGH